MKLTQDHIDALIEGVEYTIIEPNVTICALVLKSGFRVIGHSACLDPSVFDPEIGQQVAYENARDKLWELEGYHQKKQTGPDFKYRLYKEHDDLNDKIMKLEHYLSENKDLDYQRVLLKKQLEHMSEYLYVLGERISLLER